MTPRSLPRRPLRRRPLSRRLRLGGVVVSLAALTSFLSAPAQAEAPSYVALGDSYSSGTGTRSYLADGTSCQRSTSAYPSLIAAARGYALNFRACSGAKIPDVTNTQLSALGPATSYVTISVGGNDAGFADVLTECALPGWMSNCGGKISTARSFVTNTLPGRLGTLYASIRSKAPNAQVVVVGYPRIFMGEDCNAFTWFSPTEQSQLNAMADLLNSRLATAAATQGFGFANPTSRFIGHAVCDRPEWINGLSSPISESFHPNRDGHTGGYTPSVSGVLTGTSVAVTRSTVQRAASQRASLTAQQRQYAAADRTIEPKEFRIPDLTTARARKAARKAGVDLERFLSRSR